MGQYPCLEFHLEKLRNNLREVSKRCKKAGIALAGVVKGIQAFPELLKEYLPFCDQIAFSQLQQVHALRSAGIVAEFLLLRIPQPSEIAQMVSLVDCSLNSQLCVVWQIERECARQNRKHKVILMADEGDLREGYWDKERMIEDAVVIETQMPHVHLEGIGVNLGCYGSILPTEKNLGDLVRIARKVEERIGRKLEVISGGATTSFELLLQGRLPKGINHLRLGEVIMNARDLFDRHGVDLSFLDSHVPILKAEVVEVFEKPTYPVGEIDVDAFGHKQDYCDRGMRRRAILALGRQDVGYLEDLIPRSNGVSILGGSSDHLILDIQDSREEWYPGKIVDFDLNYGTLMFATNSSGISIRYLTI